MKLEISRAENHRFRQALRTVACFPLRRAGGGAQHAAVMCLAVPGRLLAITGDEPLFRTGRVSFEGVVKDVSLACVPEARVNDYVLVHAGLALGIVDESEAAEVFALLAEMEAAEEAPGRDPS